jgi:hypothetical protein
MVVHDVDHSSPATVRWSIQARSPTMALVPAEPGKYCGGSIHFPGGKFIEYKLGPTSEAVITASFSGSAIRIGVPAPDLALFASRDRLSLSAEIPYSKTKPLRVFIERDLDNLAPYSRPIRHALATRL